MQNEDRQANEQNAALLLILVQGEREIKAGEGYSLDEVMREADELLVTES